MLPGASTPASSSSVGATSILRTTCDTVEPAGTRPGAYASIGTRIDSS